MLRLLRQATRNLHRLGHGRVRAQFVLPRFPDLASYDVGRPLKFLQHYCDLRIVQISAVCYIPFTNLTTSSDSDITVCDL